VSAGGGSGVLPDRVVSRLYTAVVSDILDVLGHHDHVLDPAIRPLGRAGVTMACDQTPEAGSLYRLDPDRSVTRLLTGVTISNGLAWSGNGTTFYHIDSPTQGIGAFDYDLETGRLANRRRLVEIPQMLGCPTA
jgi:sugar lactone lactonase YvrE